MRTGFVVLLALCLAVLGIGSSLNAVQAQIASPDFPTATNFAPSQSVGGQAGQDPEVVVTCTVDPGKPDAYLQYKKKETTAEDPRIITERTPGDSEGFVVKAVVENRTSQTLSGVFVKVEVTHQDRGLVLEKDGTKQAKFRLPGSEETVDISAGQEETFASYYIFSAYPGSGWSATCEARRHRSLFFDESLDVDAEEFAIAENTTALDYEFSSCNVSKETDGSVRFDISATGVPRAGDELYAKVVLYKNGREVDQVRGKLKRLLNKNPKKTWQGTLRWLAEDIDEPGPHTYDCVLLYHNNLNTLANKLTLVEACSKYSKVPIVGSKAQVACLAFLIAADAVDEDGNETELSNRKKTLFQYPIVIRSDTYPASGDVATSVGGEPDGVIVRLDPRWGKLIVDPPLLGHQGGDATVRVYTLEPTNPESAISAPAIYAVIPEEIVVPGASDRWDGSVAPCETAAVVGPDYTEYCWQATFEGVPQNASFDTNADGVVVFKELAYAVKVASDRIMGAAPESLFRVAGRSPFSSDRALLEALYEAAGGENWRSETAADRDTTKAWLTLRDVGDWYGVTVDGDQRVTRLELGRNYLKGGLPDEVGYLEHLEHLDLHANNLVKAGIEFGNNWTGLSGSIPRSLGRLGQLTLLDLSFNSLGGAIPIELASLKSLDTLDLSVNRLSGEIPPELGALKGLEILDLSDNRLSGEIPAELTLLTNLRYLGLSDNRFTGCIPAALRNVPSSDLDDLDIPYCEDAPSETASFAHNTALDFDGLSDAGNDYPNGIWSDGTTLWVVDVGVEKLYAYDLATGARIPSKELDTLESAGNTNPRGIWSDGTTIWVTDYSDDKIYAYNLVTGARIEGQDFNTLDGAGNNKPLGLWSDGATMWVADSGEEKLFAYGLTTKARIPSKDFDTLEGADNQSPEGLWSDGTTMWVSDYTEEKIYAYDLATTLRVPSLDYDVLSATGNTDPVGIWSDGETMWVADETGAKIYAYGTASPLGRPAGLTATTGAESGEVVLRWTPAAAATVHWIYFQKADGTGGGHWPTALAGAATTATISGLDVGQEYEFWVRAGQEQAAGTTHRSEWSNAAQATSGGVVAALGDGGFARNFGQDFAFGGSNLPRGVWSDGTTMWVADGADGKVYAYDLASQARDHGKDFNALRDALNHDPRGIWSDGTTMWVTDQDRGRIYAYDLLSTERDDGKDFNTLETAGNSSPVGIWSDGATMWVADQNSGKIYAYNLASKAREANKDFDTLEAAGNDDPQGLWSDGTTMWVVDKADAKVYAYDLASKVQEPSRDFNTLGDAFNHEPRGLWSDGTTMWVADEANDKIYAYHLANKAWDASKDLHALRGGVNDYPSGLWSDGTTMWVAGQSDGKIYAYGLATKARDASNDFNTLRDAGNDYPNGLWSDGTTMWVADLFDGNIYAYDMASKARDPSKDFDTLDTATRSSQGFWSDGTTMWVAGQSDGKIYAYDTVTKARDPSKDFDTLGASGNNSPQGIWSDGTTMWVADLFDEIYAYDLATKARDPSKDFRTLRAAGNIHPHDMWSDGTTMWVTEWHNNGKIYAYDLVSKAREPGSDFGVLRGNGDHDPRGIWSDGTTMWVADHFDYWIYAYDLVSKARDPSRDLYNLPVLEYGIWSDGTTMWVTEWHNNGKISAYDLASKALDPSKDFNTLDAAGNNNPRGLWSDGTTMWVTDHQIGGTIYAYDLASKARDPSKDFNTHLGDGHDDPVALWSDRVTMWVADAREDKIFAYDLASKARDASKDFNTLDAAGNNHPRDIWSDGTTMWVTDASDRKIYAYNMPGGAQTSDRALLVALYNATGGPNWTNNANWLSSEPLNEWHGVNTDDSGHVTELNLDANELTGQMPPELGDIENLSKLYLHRNNLTEVLPESLGNLSNLEVLSLGGNQFTGTMPSSLGSLSNLEMLYLWGNQLTGTVPNSLGNLTNLTDLSLHRNQLTGPVPSQLGNLSNLEVLSLGDNQLTGVIPSSLGSLSNLEMLYLWGNQLTGTVPNSLGNLTNLMQLQLNDNQLTGPVPSQLGNLSNLEVLSLNNNQLTGQIPLQLGNLSNLTHLNLNDNSLLGPVPAWLSNLSNLEALTLDDNQLTGQIPPEWARLTNLRRLDLNENPLGGHIPTWLGNLSGLEYLNLGGSQLSGEIPSQLGNLANLQQLSLWSNQLSGSIPAELGNLANLGTLSLSGNELSGSIPSELGNLANLQQLTLWGNQLSGSIPPELGNLANLGTLSLSGNELSGSIPPELSSLPNLEQLYLSGNALTGCVPAALYDVKENDLSDLGLPDCGDASTVPEVASVDQPTFTIVNRDLEYGYEIVLSSGWEQEKEGRYNRSSPWGQILISSQRLQDGYTLEHFSQAVLSGLRGDWWSTASLLEVVSIQEVTTGDQTTHRLRYRVQESPEYCVVDVEELIAISEALSGSPEGFRVRAWMCEADVASHQATREQILDSFGIITKPSTYYRQFISVNGVVVKATDIVEQSTVHAGADIVVAMLSGRADIAQCMAGQGAALAIIPRDQPVTTIPEFAHLKGQSDFTGRPYDSFQLRGLGGTRGQPVSAAGEEQLLDSWGPEQPYYPYRGLVAVHVFAGGIQSICFTEADDEQWRRFYDDAVDAGLYPGTHMMANGEEFFAVFSTGYFEVTDAFGADSDRGTLETSFPEEFEALDAIYGGAILAEKYRELVPP